MKMTKLTEGVELRTLDELPGVEFLTIEREVKGKAFVSLFTRYDCKWLLIEPLSTDTPGQAVLKFFREWKAQKRPYMGKEEA